MVTLIPPKQINPEELTMKALNVIFAATALTLTAGLAQADAVRLLVACPQPVRAALCASLGGGTLGTLQIGRAHV